MVLVFSALVYLAEPADSFPRFFDALWFCIVTIGTTGYGDYTPKTVQGRTASGLLIISSALYMAMPLGIVGNAFCAVWEIRDQLLLVRHVRERFLENGYVAMDAPIMFSLFDTDGSEELDINEFIGMLRQMHIELSHQCAIDLFKYVDGDDSGAIDCQEFIRAIFPEAMDTMYGASIEDDLPTPAPKACK